MPIELSTQLIHTSIASVLNRIDPNAEIFDNPTQQGTPYPAWYIVHRSPVERQRECGNRYVLVYQIDIWYMLQQNITRMYDQYTAIAERLQEEIEYLPIYGYENVLIHTYENSWGLEMNAMKYSITLRIRCSRSTSPDVKMAVIEDLDVFIKSLGRLKKIRYVCTRFPDFDMGIETLQYCEEGKSVVLPFVGGIYRDGDNRRWEPIAWSVGQFGAQYGPITDDETVNLYMGEVVGFDVVIGGTVGVGENLGKDIVWRISDMTKTPWHYVGPELVLDVEPVYGGADLTRDAYKPIGPQKSLGPSPVYGGTVEKYTPPPKYYTAYFNAGQGNDTKPDSSSWSVYGGSRGMYELNSSEYIPYDATKKYVVTSVFYVDGATITDPNYIRPSLVWINDKNYADISIGVLRFHYGINNKITGKPCGCTYEITDA